MTFYRIFITVMTLLISNILFAGSIILTGVYQGKNIYVQNPFTSNMQDFCTEDVFVNDIKIMSNIKQSAFEIDLSQFNINDQIRIKIIHKDDCKPRVLNPQVIRQKSAFLFTSFVIDHEQLNWATKGEKTGSKISIEQFIYNNWVSIKDMPAKGSATLNNYISEELHHSGTNKYRIKYTELDAQVFYSRVLEHTSTKEPVTFYPKRASTTLYLSRQTNYEILNSDGALVRKGNAKDIPVEDLKTGVYYLNVDNKTEKFLKK